MTPSKASAYDYLAVDDPKYPHGKPVPKQPPAAPAFKPVDVVYRKVSFIKPWKSYVPRTVVSLLSSEADFAISRGFAVDAEDPVPTSIQPEELASAPERQGRQKPDPLSNKSMAERPVVKQKAGDA